MFHVKHRLLPLLLALVLALGCLSPALAAEGDAPVFSDVAPDAWYAPYVEICVREGLLNGTGDGKFTPDGPVNEDEAIVMAARVLWHADGGEGPLPQGPTPEEMVRRMGDDAEYWFQYGVDTAQWMSELWSWDGLCYLLSRVHEEDYDLPLYLTTYPATRSGFFHALAFAAQGLELPAINEIDQVPGARARDEDLLRLYRAGILTGTDAYGSFSGQQALTRAEAAAALARLLRPELRLSFRPESMDYPYTLTYLTDGDDFRPLVTYPVCDTETGILSLDGVSHDWPGHVFSNGVETRGDYCRFLVVGGDPARPDDPYASCTVLMDAQGRLPFPLWTYDDLYPLSDGGFLAMKVAAGSEHRWYLLSSDGAVTQQLSSTYGTPTNDWSDYNEGLCPRFDETSELAGYVDAAGEWVIQPQWLWVTPFRHGQAVVGQADGAGVIDANGEMVIPLMAGSLLSGWVSPGSDAPLRYRWDRLGGGGWLDGQGNAVPGPDQGEYQNGWFWDGQRYYDLSGQPVSEDFDWCGGLNADGQGFVGLNGKIYRIDFAQ